MFAATLILALFCRPSRLCEWIFGGVTRELVAKSSAA